MKNKRIFLLLTTILVLCVKSPLVLPVSKSCKEGGLIENNLIGSTSKGNLGKLVKKVIDGKDTDWQGSSAYFDPFDDELFPVDYQTAWFEQDSQSIYFAYRNRIPIDETQFGAWYVYIDSDVDLDTGFRINNLGADFLLEGNTLFKYKGSGDLWEWKRVRKVQSAVDSNFAEIAIDRSEFTQSNKFKLLFYGANMGVGGSINDTLPISINLDKSSRVIDGSNRDWPSKSGYPDIEKASKSPVDFTKAWFHHDNHKVYLAYHNRIPIDPNQLWAWHVFIDSDAQVSTGFQSRSIGADFLLEGKSLFRYSGTGKDWQWQAVGEIEAALSGHFAEFAISRSVFTPSSELKLLFYGSNPGDNDSLLVAVKLSNEEIHSTPSKNNATKWAAPMEFKDKSEVGAEPVDFLSASFFQDSNKIYLSYCNRVKIDIDQLWAWHIYIDSDREKATGYSYDGIGADYILEGNTLFKYTGSAEKNWKWETVTEVESDIKEDFAEFAIDKKFLNQSNQYQFILFGSNSALGGKVNDKFRIIP